MTNVVYDEFKYFSRPFDLNEDYHKMKIEMIQLSKKPSETRQKKERDSKFL